MVVKGQVGVGACREAELVVAGVMVAVDLREGGAGDEAGIETLGVGLSEAKQRHKTENQYNSVCLSHIQNL